MQLAKNDTVNFFKPRKSIDISVLQEEMYNTMNSYYKYISIPKSSFYIINILILSINTGEKYLKYSIHFANICNYQPL